MVAALAVASNTFLANTSFLVMWSLMALIDSATSLVVLILPMTPR